MPVMKEESRENDYGGSNLSRSRRPSINVRQTLELFEKKEKIKAKEKKEDKKMTRGVVDLSICIDHIGGWFCIVVDEHFKEKIEPENKKKRKMKKMGVFVFAHFCWSEIKTCPFNLVGLVSLFNGISTFVDDQISKPP